MKGEILCEEETLGGEFFLLFSILVILFNEILSFLSHFNSWFLTIGPICRIFKGEPMLEMEEMHIWSKKVELPAFMGTDPIGWIVGAEKF